MQRCGVDTIGLDAWPGQGRIVAARSSDFTGRLISRAAAPRWWSPPLPRAGKMVRKYDTAVEIIFDRFWVDVGPDSLRADLDLQGEGEGEGEGGVGGCGAGTGREG